MTLRTGRPAQRARSARTPVLRSRDKVRRPTSMRRTTAERPRASTPPTATIPGAFEGETVTRRRFMTGTAHAAGAVAAVGLPAARPSASRSGPIFEKHERALAGRRPARRLPRRHLRPEGHHDRRRASARRARPRSTSASATRSSTPRRPTSTTSSSRSRRAACTSAARCASSRPPQRFICPCHGGVYDFAGKVAGGPPVRPLDRFYTRVRNGTRRGRPALLGQPRAASASRRAIPGEPLDGIGQYLYPSRPTVRKIPGT